MLFFHNSTIYFFIAIGILSLFSNIYKSKTIPIFLYYIFTGFLFARFLPQHLYFAKQSYLWFSSIAIITLIWSAGTNISIKEYKINGKIGMFLGVLPAMAEALTVTIVAFYLLKWNLLSSILLGFVLGAVSPAVVIPFMNNLKIKHPKNQVPATTLISTTLDDVVAIVGFTLFLSINLKGGLSLEEIIRIISTIFVSVPIGYMFAKILNRLFIRPRIALIISICLIFVNKVFLGEYQQIILVSLIASSIITNSNTNIIGNQKLNKFKSNLWQYIQIPLFFIIGTFMVNTNLKSIKLFFVVLILGLIARILITWFIIRKTKFSKINKQLLLVSQIPKATVQATIGGVALSNGIAHGDTIAYFAVLSIIITAPIGSVLMQLTSNKIKN